MRVLAVPVKHLDRAKSRLAAILSPGERATLSLAMFQDVLDACMAQAGWDVWVVSHAEAALKAAVRSGARPLRERGASLLAAVGQVERAVAGRATNLGVVLADLPLATPMALRAALARGASSPVAAVPAESDGGTNVLLRTPPSVIPARFGWSSYPRHRLEAYRARVTLQEVKSPELGFDLDRPADLVRLLEFGGDSRARSACLEMGLADRLRVRA
jgi:2-phospho-L-lactate guanylyltransferase